MLFPEFLFQLSTRDQQVTWLDPIFSERSDSSAAVEIITLLSEVPLGRAMILTSASIDADPGAAQSVRRLRITTNQQAGSPAFTIAAARFPVVANAEETLNWSGQIIIPSQWRIVAIAAFDAAVAINSIVSHLSGMLIPIGNIQRV